MRSRAVRTWRGVAAAVFATFVAAVSHSAANGAPAPLLGVLLALTIAVPVCVALAGRRLSWVRLSLAVGLSQFAFHGLLGLGVGESSGAALPAGHLHGIAAAGDDLTAALASTTVAHSHAGGGMWGAHAVAAVLTVLAFGVGERSLRALIELLAWRILAWRPISLPLPARQHAYAVPERIVALPHPVVLSALRRRGPPATA